MQKFEIHFEPFGRQNYTDLISWIDSEESLMQFGGPLFTYPLTPEQLDNSIADPNRIAFCVVENTSGEPIGHAEIYLSENSAKLGRILIGAKEHRGKGLGQQIVHLLLDYVFNKFGGNNVELNVFDWNTSAIRCYEKVGFTINPEKKLTRTVKDQTWTAINMVLARNNLVK